MPSIIDSLVVELGLDPSKFAEGRQRLQDELGRTNQAVAEFGKNVEEHGQKISDVFTFMKRGAAGVLAMFVGDEAASFIDRVAAMDAHTMRLAHSIGMSTRELSVWGNMVRAVGGNASDASSLFGSLNDALMSFSTGQALPSSPLTWLAGMSGVNLLQGGNPNDVFMKLVQGAMSAGRTDQQRRQFLSFIPGMNEGMMFLALSGRMEELRKHFEGLVGDVDKSAAAAADLQSKTADLTTSLENLGRVGIPVLTQIVNFLTSALGFLTNTTGDDVIKGAQSGAAGAWNWLTDPKPRSLRDLYNAITGAGPDASGAPAAGGGTRGDRNNNPGNIKFGAFAQAHGATSADSGGFAVFPDAVTGTNAMSALLFSQYQGLTLAQIQRKWVGNADSGYLSSMMSATGLKATDVPNLGSGDIMLKLIRGMIRGEGTGGTSSHKTTSVNIGSINVTSGKADPKAVADQIPESIRRSSMLAGINSGLV